jgi:hypothetical protein
MEWLCEVTSEEIVRVGRKTETMEELETGENKEEKSIQSSM